MSRLPNSSSMMGLNSVGSSNLIPNNSNNNNSSKPIHIGRGNASSSNNNSSELTGVTGQGPMLASSCPVFAITAPRAPVNRPRLPSMEPPSLALPPSPPVFAPVTSLANGSSTTPSQNVKGPSSRATGQGSTNQGPAKVEKYSRSLSFYPQFDYLSASAPSQRGQFLSNIHEHGPMGTISPNNNGRQPNTSSSTDNDDTIDDDVDDGERLGRKLSISERENNIDNMDPNALLSKSPTIFSILSSSQRSTPAIFGSINNLSNTNPNNPITTNGLGPGSNTSNSGIFGSLNQSGRSVNDLSFNASSRVPINNPIKSNNHTKSNKSNKTNNDDADADLQFSISLTDESDSLLEGDLEDDLNDLGHQSLNNNHLKSKNNNVSNPNKNSSNRGQQDDNMDFLPLY